MNPFLHHMQKKKNVDVSIIVKLQIGLRASTNTARFSLVHELYCNLRNSEHTENFMKHCSCLISWKIFVVLIVFSQSRKAESHYNDRRRVMLEDWLRRQEFLRYEYYFVIFNQSIIITLLTLCASTNKKFRIGEREFSSIQVPSRNTKSYRTQELHKPRDKIIEELPQIYTLVF